MKSKNIFKSMWYNVTLSKEENLVFKIIYLPIKCLIYTIGMLSIPIILVILLTIYLLFVIAGLIIGLFSRLKIQQLTKKDRRK